MRTTLRIDDRLYRRAKAKSSQLGLSLTRFLEEALENRLDRLDTTPSSKVRLPVSSAAGRPMNERELKRKISAAELRGDISKVK